MDRRREPKTFWDQCCAFCKPEKPLTPLQEWKHELLCKHKGTDNEWKMRWTVNRILSKLPQDRHSEDCWLHPNPPSPKAGRIALYFRWRLTVNFGRGRGTAPQSTFYQRLPIGTPTFGDSSAFSHIKVVSKESLITDGCYQDEEIPTFRSISYSLTQKPARSTSTTVNPTDQSANQATPKSNQSFAQLVRAAATAESQEAEDVTSNPSSATAPGMVKLKPSRNKGASKWKPLDPSEWHTNRPETPSDVSEYPENTQPAVFYADNYRQRGLKILSRPESVVQSSRASSPNGRSNLQTLQIPGNNLVPNECQITRVFGKELPTPRYLEFNSTLHVTDGTVQCVRHPNNDVSAHQWSTGESRWVNIGQYSNARKRIEGQMASERLWDETTKEFSQQHTLEYFRALSEQREEEFKVGRVKPSIRPLLTQINRTIAEAQLNRSKLNTSASQNQRTPAISEHTMSFPSSMFYRPDSGMQTMEDPFVDASKPSTTLKNGEPTFEQNAGNSGYRFRVPPSMTPQPFSISSRTESADTKFIFAEQERCRIQQTLWPEQRQQVLSDIHVGEDAASVIHRGPVISAPTEAIATPDLVKVPATREFLMDYIMKNGDTTTALSMSTGPARTVLNDPVRLATRPLAVAPPVTSEPTYQNNQMISPIMRPPPGLPTAQSSPLSRVTLLDSVPEPESSFRERQRRALEDATLDKHLNEEEEGKWGFPPCRDFPGPPTRQNFNGPFFTDVARKPRELGPWPIFLKPMQSREKQVWWNSGKQRARQSAAIDALNVPAPPGFQSHPVDQVTNHLLIGVYDNLASYVKGIPEDRKEQPFAKYKQSADWCIDQTYEASKSFLGEDWGKAPNRIGRDPRYRPMMHNPRDTLFEMPETSHEMLERGRTTDRRFRTYPIG
ncbi:hypothetical protein M501DRAFT_1057376 [Patellaria atrata CBS 101060]|uniref:Uncharacterized protein n=1 Tax=Patellaria atrata CBS 101060 TaxID=1346257 RepID=A0A9P4SAK4_9PEZI|nr:hypothetical protein M501DRAFT_1057376 [Patellaria atrata CBS 101060]